MLATVTAQSACETAATDWGLANLWIANNPAQQLAGVEALCCANGVAGAACAAQDAMIAELEAIASVCGGAQDQTVKSVTGLIKDLMCSQHDGVYCLTNVLAFIDFAYMTQLSDPAGSAAPSLEAVLAAEPRREAMCASPTCRYEVFHKVTTALGDPAATAVIRDIAQDIFCGCENDPSTGSSCHDFDLFTASDQFDVDKVCTDTGEVSHCARTNAMCNNVNAVLDPAICRDADQDMIQVASFTINFGNVKFSYYEANIDLVMRAMATDFMVNFRGLLPDDCSFVIVAADDGSLSVNVVIKGENLNKLLKLAEMIKDGKDRAELKLFVVAALEALVPNDINARSAVAFLSEDITISEVVVTEVVDGSNAPALTVGAAAIAACVL